VQTAESQTQQLLHIKLHQETTDNDQEIEHLVPTIPKEEKTGIPLASGVLKIPRKPHGD